MKKLFNEFPPVSTEQWEEKIQVDLKGADYEKKLVWRTQEGFKVNPYYRQEDLKGKEYLSSLPGEFPYTRGSKKNDNDWDIRQDIQVGGIEKANKQALYILDRGVNSLGFITAKKKGESSIKSQDDLSALLKGVHLDCISLNFAVGHNAPSVLEYLSSEAEKHNIDKDTIKGGVDFDPLGHLSLTGWWAESEEADFASAKSLIEFAKDKLPKYKVLTANGCIFNNAGASVVEELALSLSMAATYLEKLTDAGLEVGDVAKRIQFNLGIGSNYFMEIAKVRAIRLLWAKLVDAFKPGCKCSSKLYVNSVTSTWNQTIYDPYVNVLRATTESMAAVLGGTNSLVVRPFDFSFASASENSDRIARNIQIILKEESYFDKIVDPSAGSYYIENLTDSLIDEAWKLFLEIDEKGGYLQALKDGVVQEIVEKTATDRANKIATRREVLLGTNQFPNFNEVVKDNVSEELAFQEKKTGGDAVKPIKKFRGAIEFEKLRIATEKHSKRPKAFMLTNGNLTMRKARAAFSCNFFACAGYEVVDNLGFDSAEQGVKAALEANADIVVVCSSDDEYVDLVPAVAEQLKDKAIVVVAGAPKCMEDLKAKGIENFIHVRSNVLETLQGFNKQLGIG